MGHSAGTPSARGVLARHSERSRVSLDLADAHRDRVRRAQRGLDVYVVNDKKRAILSAARRAA